MRDKLVIIFAAIAILIIWSLIHKAVKHHKEKKKIERWKSIWTSKNYSDFFREVSSRGELDQTVSSKEFLTAGGNMSVQDFLSALVQYRFIECNRQNSARYGYNYMYSQKSKTTITISCSSDVSQTLAGLLSRSVKSGIIRDVLLLYFALYAVTKDGQPSEYLKSAVNFIHNNGYHIYDSIVSEQSCAWNKIIGNVQDESNPKFSDAELTLFQIQGNLSRADFLCMNKSAVGPYDEVLLKGHVLRFYPSSHSYFVDGIRILSVTQMLKEVDYSYANYVGVSSSVLNRAAARGTALHAEIQNYEEKGIRGSTQEFFNYIRLKEENGFSVETCEQYVLICYQNVPVCAGRFDLLIKTATGKPAMADIKRTSTYKKDDVTKQINLYRLGYLQTYGGRIDEAYCLRLREDVAQFRPVDVDEQQARTLLERYVTRLQKNAKSYFDYLQE